MKFSAGGDQVFASYSGDNIYSFLSTDHARASEAYCEAQGLSRCHLIPCYQCLSLHGALCTAYTTCGASHFESCFVHIIMIRTILKPPVKRKACQVFNMPLLPLPESAWRIRTPCVQFVDLHIVREFVSAYSQVHAFQSEAFCEAQGLSRCQQTPSITVMLPIVQCIASDFSS